MGVGGYRNTWAELWLCQIETVGEIQIRIECQVKKGTGRGKMSR